MFWIKSAETLNQDHNRQGVRRDTGHVFPGYTIIMGCWSIDIYVRSIDKSQISQTRRWSNTPLHFKTPALGSVALPNLKASSGRSQNPSASMIHIIRLNQRDWLGWANQVL